MAPDKRKLLHSHHGKNYMEVVDQGDFRSLYFQGSVVQSSLSLKEPGKLILRYTQYMMASSLLARREPQKILLIGVGAGALLHFFHRHLPNSQIEAVDYSEHILKIARGYFSLPENNKITIHCSDGLDYLRQSKNATFDLILIDAFNDKGMAKNIYSNEFFKLAREKLTANGIICSNLWSGNQKLFHEIKKVIFKNCQSSLFIPVRKRENIIAVLFQTAIPWEKICPSSATLNTLSQRYEIDFFEISTAARKNNMKLGEKLQHWFS